MRAVFAVVELNAVGVGVGGSHSGKENHIDGSKNDQSSAHDQIVPRACATTAEVVPVVLLRGAKSVRLPSFPPSHCMYMYTYSYDCLTTSNSEQT